MNKSTVHHSTSQLTSGSHTGEQAHMQKWNPTLGCSKERNEEKWSFFPIFPALYHVVKVVKIILPNLWRIFSSPIPVKAKLGSRWARTREAPVHPRWPSRVYIDPCSHWPGVKYPAKMMKIHPEDWGHAGALLNPGSLATWYKFG